MMEGELGEKDVVGDIDGFSLFGLLPFLAPVPHPTNGNQDPGGVSFTRLDM